MSSYVKMLREAIALQMGNTLTFYRQVTHVVPLHGGTFEMSLSKLHGVSLLFTLGEQNIVLVKVLLLMCMYVSILQSSVLYSH